MKRLVPKKTRALLALATLTALVAVATMRTNVSSLAQEPKTPTRQTKETKKVEKAPEKADEKVPMKVEGKVPTKEEGRNPERVPVKGEDKIPMKEQGGVPGVRPVPRKGDPAVPTRKGGEEISKDPVPGRVRPVPGKEVPKVTPKEDEKVVIEGLPEDFDDQQRLAYRRLEHPDLSFEEYLRFAKLEFGRLRQLKMNPALHYQPVRRGNAALQTVCGNGDFEPPMNPNNAVNSAEWSGGHGSVLGTGVVDFGNFTAGLVPGAITTSTAHQTVVSAGTDPNVPIQMTGPDTSIPSTVSPNAVRIGNAVNGYGAELLSKTFTVTPSDTLIRFWYAVVLQNPVGHPLNIQPAFQVRILDNSTGTPVVVPGLVNLGNGPSGKLVADVNNPFFLQKVVPGVGTIVYTNWQCAQISLSTLVGKTVTVEFVTQDCGAGGHWGYAYVDDFCGTCAGSPTGDIAFEPRGSTQCGKGQVCFKYTLPSTQNAAGNVTGTAAITLDIYQGGVLLQTLQTSPPTLSAGTHVCFPIDPATIPGLNPALGFDLVANGVFTLSGNVLPLSVGTAPDGRIPGQNNDYNNPRICNEPPPVACGCCPGENLVKNGDFDHPSEIHSEYELAGGFDSLFPGTYSVNHVDKIGKACSNWKLPKACDGTKNFYENVLIVNGQTNQPAGSTSVIWSQQIVLPSNPGGKEADYRLCFRYLPLPQCCFDIQAKPIVLVNHGKIPLTDVCDEDNGCGHRFSATFHGSGTIDLQIVLPEDGRGDGNDLLIDNISVVQLVKVPSALTFFTLLATPGTGSTYDVTLTAPGSLTTPYNWVWEMWADPSTNPTSPIQSVGGNAPTTTFTGLAASTTYVFKLKVWSDCNELTGSKQTWSFDPNARKATGKTVEDPNPEPVNRKTVIAGNPEAVKRENGPLPAKRSR